MTNKFATYGDVNRFLDPDLALGQANLSSRYGRIWVAGQRGKPCINADMASGTEATREVADPDFEVLGTNGTSALSTFNAEGGILFTTAGADNDQMILVPHLDTNQTCWTNVTWGTDRSVQWECLIDSGASVAAKMIWAGLKLTNTSTIATDNDQVFFKFDSSVSSGAWVCVDSVANTDTSTVTSTVVAVNTMYHLKINIDAQRIARFYLNGVLVRTTGVLTSTDLIPYIGVQANGAAAAKTLIIYGQAISREVGA